MQKVENAETLRGTSAQELPTCRSLGLLQQLVNILHEVAEDYEKHDLVEGEE